MLGREHNYVFYYFFYLQRFIWTKTWQKSKVRASTADGPTVEQHMTLWPESLQKLRVGQTSATNEALHKVVSEPTPNTEADTQEGGETGLDLGTHTYIDTHTHTCFYTTLGNRAENKLRSSLTWHLCLVKTLTLLVDWHPFHCVSVGDLEKIQPLLSYFLFFYILLISNQI